MSIIELVPLDKGTRLILDETSVTTIGRTPNIGCLDKKISRNHAELYIKPDGTLWIKPIHHNPTFHRTKSNQLITLTKDEEHQLNDNDEIGLLPNEYFYRISIQSKDKAEEEEKEQEEEEEEEEYVIEPSAIPKSPISEMESSPTEEKELSPVRSHREEKSPSKDPSLEPEGGVILHTNRALPTWMANRPILEPKNGKGRGKGKTAVTPTKTTPSPSKYRTYIGRKKAEGIVYDDDEESDEDDKRPKKDDKRPNKDAEESNEASVPSTADQTPATVVGPPKRERCPYGKFCYRKNLVHRQEAIHPGDPDWDNKENDGDDNKKPECPFGSECYRKNPDHFKEYSHTIKQSIKQRTSKRKGSDNDEDDDDGLPNEYDYNDSFIDDEELEDSVRIDRAGGSQLDPDNTWKPHRKARNSDDEDDENNSSDESEINLLKEEAAGFVQNSAIKDQRPAKKKARMQMPKDDD